MIESIWAGPRSRTARSGTVSVASRSAAAALAAAEPTTGDPKLSYKLITTKCKQGYAIYHRQFGRAYQVLQDFQQREKDWPTALDMAKVLGMRDVEELFTVSAVP